MRTEGVVFEWLAIEVPVVVVVVVVMVKSQPAEGPAQLLYLSYVQAPAKLGRLE